MNRVFPSRNSSSVSWFRPVDRWTAARKTLSAEPVPHSSACRHFQSASCKQLFATAVKKKNDKIAEISVIINLLLIDIKYLICEEESLQQWIHVTRCSLVLQSDKAGVFLRVPADPVRSLSVDVNLQRYGIVLAVAFFGIEDLVPVHEVAEAPIVLFAEKQVLNLAGKILNAVLLGQ